MHPGVKAYRSISYHIVGYQQGGGVLQTSQCRHRSGGFIDQLGRLNTASDHLNNGWDGRPGFRCAKSVEKSERLFGKAP